MTDVPPLLTKCCSKCGEWKPLGEFPKNKYTRDGKRYDCKPCAAETMRAYRRAHPERYIAIGRKARAKLEADPERLAQMKATRKRRTEKPEYKVTVTAQNRRRHRERLAKDPEYADHHKYRVKIKALRKAIAVETCKRLGIDLTKLAEEQYDAEQRAKQTEQGLHQDQGSSAEDLRTAAGRPDDQAG